MHQFENIIGNNLIINAMQSSIKSGKISHSYIIDGEKGSGRHLLAITFAKTLQCLCESVNPCDECVSCTSVEHGTHPDIIYVGLDKNKSIGVDDVRDKINHVVDTRPYKYKYKIFIIENGETLTVQAQNALLKTIEEPPSYAIFIIISSNYSKFLPTVLSRSILFKIKPLNSEQVATFLKRESSVDNSTIEFLTAFANGNIGRAVAISSDENFANMRNNLIDILININNEDLVKTLLHYKFFEEHKERVNELLEITYMWYRDVLVYKETNSTEYLLQKDKESAIIESSKNYSIINLINKLTNVNDTLFNLSRNGNFQISIEILLLKLKEK